jgi:hypothetical protein
MPVYCNMSTFVDILTLRIAIIHYCIGQVTEEMAELYAAVIRYGMFVEIQIPCREKVISLYVIIERVSSCHVTGENILH